MLPIYVYNVVSLSADQSSYLSPPYRWDLCPCSDSPFVVASIDTQVYPIVGLKPPLSCLLSYYRPLRPSIPLDYSTSLTTQPSWATILTIHPGVDHRLKDTYHQQDPLALRCLGRLPTPP